MYTQEASWRFAKLDELSVGFRTLRLSAPKKTPQKMPVLDAVTLYDFNADQPISKIPTELLCDIFTKFVSDSTISRVKNATGPLVSRHSYVDPTILGQVCSHWRDTALNLPTLWSTICIRNPAKSQLYRTHLWLERSADQPLNLTLEDGIDNRDLNATWNILRAFYSHADKWRRIDFCVPPDLLALIGRLGQEAPACERLEYATFRTSHPFSNDLCQRHPTWEVPYLDTIWSFFDSSPKLRDASYTVKFPDFLPQNTPYQQLTSVEILFFLSPEDLLSLVSRLPNLCSLRADVRHSNSVVQRSTKSTIPLPVCLKNLRTFHLSANLSLAEFFSQLVLPSLEGLHLSCHSHDDQFVNHHPTIQGLLQRSDCCLKKFELVDRTMTDSESSTYFAMPELQGLSFLGLRAQLSTSSISLLSERVPGRPHTFLPELRELHLSRTSDTPDGLLSEMISSRLSLLKTFTVLSKGGKYGPIDKSFFVQHWNIVP